jgi:hypothetical protein
MVVRVWICLMGVLVLVSGCNLQTSQREAQATPFAAVEVIAPNNVSMVPTAAVLPTLAPPTASGPQLVAVGMSVSGTLFEDTCAGCGEGQAGNGVWDSGEQGISGVSVVLYRAACGADPSSQAALQTLVTSADGRFVFGVPAGEYCLAVNTMQPQNMLLLAPGAWTNAEGGAVTFVLDDATPTRVINLAWDYQFR